MSNNINQQGIGLGLTVSNQICQKLGGNLFIERSEPHKGSKFTFYLPTKLCERQSETIFTSENIGLSNISKTEQSFSEHSGSERLDTEQINKYIKKRSNKS